MWISVWLILLCFNTALLKVQHFKFNLKLRSKLNVIALSEVVGIKATAAAEPTWWSVEELQQNVLPG